MTHPNRSRRKANARRRLEAAAKQTPKAPEEQAQRREWRLALRQKLYPHPPAYRYSYADPKPVQPMCYDLRALRGVG